MRFTQERKLWKKGYTRVVGIDEVGRGPFAGPVVAAAVMIYPEQQRRVVAAFRGLADSKKLSEKKREYFFALAIEHTGIVWRVGKSSEKQIDKINILEGTKRSMEKAVRSLEKEIPVDYILLDGNFPIISSVEQQSIIKGDESIFSCALASVNAPSSPNPRL